MAGQDLSQMTNHFSLLPCVDVCIHGNFVLAHKICTILSLIIIRMIFLLLLTGQILVFTDIRVSPRIITSISNSLIFSNPN